MSDDGNDDPSLMSENGDGPSLSVHDEKDDQILTLGIYCDVEPSPRFKRSPETVRACSQLSGNPHSTMRVDAYNLVA